MRKFILFFFLFCICATATAVNKQLYMTAMSVERVGNTSIVNGSFQSYPDSIEHANTLLPCASCTYGIIVYVGYTNQPFKYASSCVVTNGKCYTVRITRQMTYAEANKLFFDTYGESIIGIYRTTAQYTNGMGMCVGTKPGISNVQGMTIDSVVREAYPGSCAPISVSPTSCTLNTNTLDLEYGVMTSSQLNSVNASKSVTGSFGVNCSSDTTLTFQLSSEEITLTEGLKASLTIKKGSQIIENGTALSIKADNLTNFDIMSTLAVNGKVAPKRYSGSAILLIKFD